MTWPYALLVGAAAAASMVAYWIMIRAVLPWTGLRQAAAVSLGSNAVASTFGGLPSPPWPATCCCGSSC